MTFPKRRAPISLQSVHYLFAAVFLLRLWVLARLAASPFLLPAQGDMHFYDEWARRLLRGVNDSHAAFYGLPGYPYLLALLYRIFGYDPFIPGLCQAALDAGTAVLLYKISLLLFEPLRAKAAKIVGLLAAAGWAFFVPAQTYAAILMPTSWGVFVFWFVIWRLLVSRVTNCALSRRSHGDVNSCSPFSTRSVACSASRRQALAVLGAAGLGLMIGLTATAVATILVLVPLVATAIIWRQSAEGWLARSTAVAAILAGIIAGTSPCWVHNRFAAHDGFFLSAHSGVNLWIGNNPTATGYPNFPPGLHAGQTAMLQDSIDAAERAVGHRLRRGEVSEFWSQKARAYIQGDFRGWLKLLAAKVCNFWNAFQYDDLSVITSLREEEVTLPGLYFGLVASLALPGLLIATVRFPASRWVTGAVLLQIGSLLTVFVTERYRLAAVPGLLIFAAFGAYLLWESLLEKRYRSVGLWAVLLLCSTGFVSLPPKDVSLWALDAYNTGLHALEAGNLSSAKRKLDLAYAHSPQNSEVNFAEGNLHLALHDTTGAKQFYHSALALNPHHSGAYNNLGVLALQEARWNVAAQFLRCALAESRNDAKTYYLLAQANWSGGDRESALAEIAEAIRLEPGQPQFCELQHRIQSGN